MAEPPPKEEKAVSGSYVQHHIRSFNTACKN